VRKVANIISTISSKHAKNFTHSLDHFRTAFAQGCFPSSFVTIDIFCDLSFTKQESLLFLPSQLYRSSDTMGMIPTAKKIFFAHPQVSSTSTVFQSTDHRQIAGFVQSPRTAKH